MYKIDCKQKLIHKKNIDIVNVQEPTVFIFDYKQHLKYN
jgi:hypothetical protein